MLAEKSQDLWMRQKRNTHWSRRGILNVRFQTIAVGLHQQKYVSWGAPMAGYWIVAPPVPMIEPVTVPEIVINGAGGVYFDNGLLMIPCYKEETLMEAPDAPVQRVLKVKIFRPAAPESIAESIWMMAQCLMLSHPHAAPPTQPQYLQNGRMHLIKQ